MNILDMKVHSNNIASMVKALEANRSTEITKMLLNQIYAAASEIQELCDDAYLNCNVG